MALYQCFVGMGRKYLKTSYYVDAPSSSTHQATVNLKIELNCEYKNMNITIGEDAYWGLVTINGKQYGQGTHDVSLVGLTSVLITNRIYANSGLHASITINTID